MTAVLDQDLSETPYGLFPVALSASMLQDEVCKRKFFERYIARVYPELDSIHLAAGAAFASGLQAAREAHYIRGENDALEQGLRQLLVKWDLPGDGHPSPKSIDRVAGALVEYLDRYPFADDRLQPAIIAGRPAIEFSFTYELPIPHPDTGEPLLYTGRCDMIGDYDGSLLLTDEKTTTRLGETWSSNFRLRGQFIGYTWAARKAGYDVAGTLVRGIAIRKTGYDIAQTIHTYPQHMVDDWYISLLQRVQSLVACYKTNEWPRNYGDICTSYGQCAYVDRCASRHPERIPGFVRKDRLYFER